MENNTVTVPAREYEELARDSEKVRILSQAVLDGKEIGAEWLGIICGVQGRRVQIDAGEVARRMVCPYPRSR